MAKEKRLFYRDPNNNSYGWYREATVIKALGMVGFLILYPTFFWYHTAISFEIIPLFVLEYIGGLYGPTCAVVVLIYLFFLVKSWPNKIASDWLFVTYTIYLLWALIWTLFHVFPEAEDFVEDGAIKLLKDLILQTGNFVIGTLLILERHSPFKRVVALAWVSMVVFSLLAYDSNTASLYHSLLLHESLQVRDGMVAYLSSYQGLARSFVFTAFVLLALTLTSQVRFLITSLSIGTLIVIGARSELMAFVFAVCCFEFLNCSKSSKNIRDLAIFSVLAASVLSVVLICFDGSFEHFRTLNVTNLMEDRSWQIRQEQMETALSAIKGNPLLGSFAFHLKTGNHGDMPHSIISAWLTLGFFGFALVCLMLAQGCYHTMRVNFKIKEVLPIWNFCFLVAMSALIQLPFTKSAFVEWLPLFFGAVVSARQNSGSAHLEEVSS